MDKETLKVISELVGMQALMLAMHIQALGMTAENQVQMDNGSAPRYSESNFTALSQSLSQMAFDAYQLGRKPADPTTTT